MKNFIRLFMLGIIGSFPVMLSAQSDVDMGKDWNPADETLIDAASGTSFTADVLEYTVNAATDNEMVFVLGGGAVAKAAANKDVYKNPTSSSFSYCQLGSGANAAYFEGRVTGAKAITALKFNGTSASLTDAVSFGVVYSDKSPFDETSIIGYATVDFALCRAGNEGVVISDVPAGTKSFRAYNPATVIVSGSGYALASEGDVTTVGISGQVVRLAYIKATLGEGAAPTLPTIAKASGTTEQTIYVGQSISSIIYRWGGTATSSSVSWDVTPAGISVTPDAEAKTVTIAGTPAAAGVYNYSVTATDGTNTTDPLTGTITVNALTKPLVAYVTNSASPTDAGDVAVIDKLKADYDVVIVLSTATGVDFSAYKAIVLAALPGSGDAGLTQYKSINKPFVNLKPFMFQSSRWNFGAPANIEAASDPKALTDVPVGVAVTDATHPVFAGMGLSNGGEVALASGSKHASFRILTPMITWITGNETKHITLATVPSGAYNYTETVNKTTDAAGAPIIYEYAAGTVLVDGNGAESTVQQKTIVIGVSEQAAGYLTSEYLSIVSNAVKYVIGDDSAIGTVTANKGAVTAKSYYDLAGRPATKAAKGVLIEKSVYEDGSISYGKVYVK